MLTVSWFLATFALLLQCIFLPRIGILAYAPWIALAVLRCPLFGALWRSAAAGAFLDLLSDDPIGLHALNYALTAFLFHRFRSPFSYDQPLHLSLCTALVSASSTLIQLALLFLFDRRVPFGGKWELADFLGMPAIDALYAFVWFAAPLAFFDWLRRYWVVFWIKRKNRFQTSR